MKIKLSTNQTLWPCTAFIVHKVTQGLGQSINYVVSAGGGGRGVVPKKIYYIIDLTNEKAKRGRGSILPILRQHSLWTAPYFTLDGCYGSFRDSFARKTTTGPQENFNQKTFSFEQFRSTPASVTSLLELELAELTQARTFCKMN